MKADGLDDGIICVLDMNTQRPVPRPAGPPDENQELFIVIDGDVVPYRKKTMAERIEKATALMNDGLASFEEAIDELGEIYE